ncbi:MAG: thiol:disulfide interchange protein DsbA/DsbL [Pseudomonadota bacterium]|nr:thiol:disulfide interchange protein DsbA/DsbL [Pseudomonadota bacterium]
MFRCASLLIAGLFFAAVGQAQQGPYQEGRHYFRIPVAQPTHAAGKVEVIEVFSYGCPACSTFQPSVDAWKKTMPSNVHFSYLPADFNAGWPLLARAFYAAQALDLSERSHQRIFDTNYTQKKPIRTEDDVVAVLSSLGVPAEKVRKTLSSFGIQTKLAQARKRVIAYQVESTPSLVVNGKWRISGQGLSSQGEMIAVLKHVLQLEAAALPAPATLPAPAK